MIFFFLWEMIFNPCDQHFHENYSTARYIIICIPLVMPWKMTFIVKSKRLILKRKVFRRLQITTNFFFFAKVNDWHKFLGFEIYTALILKSSKATMVIRNHKRDFVFHWWIVVVAIVSTIRKFKFMLSCKNTKYISWYL